MPTVSSGKVLVTGANGYVAFWVVEKLLAAGYEVRGTVRSESKAKHNNRYSHDAINRDGEHLRPIERLVDPGFYS